MSTPLARQLSCKLEVAYDVFHKLTIIIFVWIKFWITSVLTISTTVTSRHCWHTSRGAFTCQTCACSAVCWAWNMMSTSHRRGFQTLAGNMKPGSYVQPCRCNGSSWVTATDAVGWPAMADTARQWLLVQYWQIMPLSCCTRLECRVIRYWPASCLCGMLQQYAIWTPFWEDFKPDYSFCRLF